MRKSDELRPHDTVRSQLRIPAELHERLGVVCHATGRSMNAEIVRRLEDSFDGKVRVALPEELLVDLQSEASRQKTSVETLIRWRLEESKAREAREAASSTRFIAQLAKTRAEQLSLMASIEMEMQRVRELAASGEAEAPGEGAYSYQLEMMGEIYSAIETEERRTAQRIVGAVRVLRRDKQKTSTAIDESMEANGDSTVHE